MKLSEIIDTRNLKDKITIKKYISLAEKNAIAESIVEQCLVEENGMLMVDCAKKILGLELSFVMYYSDVELDMPNSLDYLCENGILEIIKGLISESEMGLIERLVNSMISERKEIHNSLSGVVNRNISNLINKIPDGKEMNKLMDKVPKMLSKIDPEFKDTVLDIFKKEKLGAK